MAEPTKPKLYQRITEEVKSEMAWPSAVASGQLIQRYKAAGGRFRGKVDAKRLKGMRDYFRKAGG